MSALPDRVEKFVREREMILPGERVLAAVSGGIDSMCLLDLLAGLRERLDFELAAANFDHGLRGAQGDEERELVENECRRLGAGFTSGKTSELAGLVKGGGNLQAEARRLRYDFLWQAADRLECRRLATGHHRDDQTETVLLRLTQGSSLVGLAGISPVSHRGRLVRPLLEISRPELEDYARERSVRWLEDPTNETDSYRRNRVRHHLIPQVERDSDPSFSAELAALAGDAAGLRGLLDDAAGKLQADGTVSVEGGRVAVDCAALESQPAVVRRHALRLAVERATEGEVILSGRPLAALDKLAVDSQSGRRLDLPGGISAWREFDRLLAARDAGGGTGSSGTGMELVEGLNRVRLGSVDWELDLCVERLDGGFPDNLLPPTGEEGALALRQVFDLERLSLPLSAGVWRQGEKIELFGSAGSKKLKKLFAERRVPVAGRKAVPVVRDSGGKVVWVCGVGRSAAAPVGSSTARVLVIEAARTSIPGASGSGGY